MPPKADFEVEMKPGQEQFRRSARAALGEYLNVAPAPVDIAGARDYLNTPGCVHTARISRVYLTDEAETQVSTVPVLTFSIVVVMWGCYDAGAVQLHCSVLFL